MNDSDIRLVEITEREIEILNLLNDGLSNSEIADRLFLALSTVKWYIRQLNSKLHTSNRDEIVERALELDLLRTASPAQPLIRPHSNLPRQSTRFVGRDTELDELHSILMNPDVRLLTILAGGGMGKTRLALEAAERQIMNFPDGVYFVPLQPLNNAEYIVPQIASSIGFQFASDQRSPKEQLLSFLSNKSMLLLIDNWEHLLDGAILANDILSAAPDVKIIAPSREKLNLSGETVYALQGLSSPSLNTDQDMLDFDAVQFLLQSAQRVQPDWQITPENLESVMRVCHLTQGMPLGILLAISWLDVYSLERICDEIEKSADILETEMRDIPERQRSIRAVFEYAWERLNPTEQQAFMKMSVFRGGFLAGAAEEVTGVNPRILQSLVNKALLIKNKAGRYEIHELLRQYAEENLKRAGLYDVTRQAHLTYFAHFAETHGKQLQTPAQRQMLTLIEAELDNLRTAWAEAIRQVDESAMVQLMQIRLFYEIHSLWKEVYQLWTEALSVISSGDSLARGELYLGIMFMSSRIGQIDQTMPYSHAAYDLYERLDIPLKKLSALGVRVNIYLASFEFERSRQIVQEVIQLNEQVQDHWHAAIIVGWQAFFARVDGDTQKAGQLLQQMVQIAREQGNFWLLSFALRDLGMLMFKKGQIQEAEAKYREAVEVARSINQWLIVQNSLALLGGLLIESGNYAEAKSLLESALRIGLDIGVMDLNWCYMMLARVAAQDNEPQTSIAYVEKAYISIKQRTSALQEPLERIISDLRLLPDILTRLERYEKAAEFLAVIANNPYVKDDPFEFSEAKVRDMLLEALNQTQFDAAWQRGLSMDFEQEVRELVAAFRS